MKNYLINLGFANLTEVQEKIVNMQNPHKNILCVSSTGSGKTAAAYNWSINTGKKTIWIEPQKTLSSSIQLALNQFCGKINLPKWTIQHSSQSEDEFLSNKYCVTTIDQVLVGYLGLGKQAIIKGKNVVTSNLIFDEVQLLETNRAFLTTINMLDEIHKHGQHNFMIMTATMPQYLIDFLAERYDMEVIICKETPVKNRHVKIYYKKDISEMINAIQERQIIICNTQAQQEYVYNLIQDKSRCIFLNSKLLATDRNVSESKVFEYFGKESEANNKILITTQIVEAGIDISANYLYSVEAPIDNLVQRDGRCVRWGGDGHFIVFSPNDIYNNIYDSNVVKDTVKAIQEIDGQDFEWQTQLRMINEILNPFYEKYINKAEIKKNRMNMINNKRSELIRDIKNVNIIVQDVKFGVNEDMFKLESVSVNIRDLKKLQGNEMYVMRNNEIKIILDTYDIDVGETVVIDNINCIYDEIGFRIRDQSMCKPFDKIDKTHNKIKSYDDYIEEEWIEHANLTKSIMINKLKEFLHIDYIKENINHISNICGLHDLGKLEKDWQKWGGDNEIPLSHFPFSKRPKNGNKKNHAHISAILLKDCCDDILFNVVLQHHKRLFCDKKNIYIEKHELHRNTDKVLKQYNLNGLLISTQKEEVSKITDDNIIKPTSKGKWILFLILTGLLMESDIESIIVYKNQKLAS